MRDFFALFHAAPEKTPHTVTETIEEDHDRLEIHRGHAFDPLECLAKPGAPSLLPPTITAPISSPYPEFRALALLGERFWPLDRLQCFCRKTDIRHEKPRLTARLRRPAANEKSGVFVAALAILVALDFVVIGPYSVTQWLYGGLLGVLLVAIAGAGVSSAIALILRLIR
ncbi:MAG: hypothetical protein N2441_06805 [Rhodocyclaceae bacterium]|nr:hypothetical protein [Rhodocyclaceae bacterium]